MSGEEGDCGKSKERERERGEGAKGGKVVGQGQRQNEIQAEEGVKRSS